MTLKNEYQEVLKKFSGLGLNERYDMLAEITENQETPELEDSLFELQSIPGVGIMTAREILFKIGICFE